MNVAVSRRIRQLGLVDFNIETAEKLASDPRRGYTLGLLFLDGKITTTQHEAGLRYAEDMSRFYGLTGVPFPSPRAQDLFAVRGESGESEAKTEAAKHARATMKKLQAVLQGVGAIDNGRRVESTVKNVCLLDFEEARGWPEHTLSFLRQGLNALARKHYGMET